MEPSFGFRQRRGHASPSHRLACPLVSGTLVCILTGGRVSSPPPVRSDSWVSRHEWDRNGLPVSPGCHPACFPALVRVRGLHRFAGGLLLPSGSAVQPGGTCTHRGSGDSAPVTVPVGFGGGTMSRFKIAGLSRLSRPPDGFLWSRRPPVEHGAVPPTCSAKCR